MGLPYSQSYEVPLPETPTAPRSESKHNGESNTTLSFTKKEPISEERQWEINKYLAECSVCCVGKYQETIVSALYITLRRQ